MLEILLRDFGQFWNYVLSNTDKCSLLQVNKCYFKATFILLARSKNVVSNQTLFSFLYFLILYDYKKKYFKKYEGKKCTTTSFYCYYDKGSLYHWYCARDNSIAIKLCLEVCN